MTPETASEMGLPGQVTAPADLYAPSDPLAGNFPATETGYGRGQIPPGGIGSQGQMGVGSPGLDPGLPTTAEGMQELTFDQAFGSQDRAIKRGAGEDFIAARPSGTNPLPGYESAERYSQLTGRV